MRENVLHARAQDSIATYFICIWRRACLPRPGEVMRLTTVLQEHLRCSEFWDKRYRVWRVSEDDPDLARLWFQAHGLL